MHALTVEDALFNVAMLALVVYLGQRFIRRRPTYSTAHGAAGWMDDKLLKAWGLLTQGGIVVGRTLSGKLLYIRDFCHVLIIGGTGSGKSSGFVSCNLLQFPGATISFDPKGELAELCSGVTIASDASGHCLNPLDAIKTGDVDACRQLAFSLIDMGEDSTDKHWNASAAKVITSALCYVTKESPPEERNLNTVMAIISDKAKLRALAQMLNKWGATYANMAGQIAQLFDKGELTKEGGSVLSSATRHLSWLDGVAGNTVTKTTFDVKRLRQPGNRLYLKVPIHFLDAHRGWLRCMTTALLMAAYRTKGSEILYMCDEAWLLSGLPAVEQMLLLGRSSGIHLALAYQSHSQVRSAFEGKESLIPDNCRTHIILEVSKDDAEKEKKALGRFTLEVVTHSSNRGMSHGTSSPGVTHNHGDSANAALVGRDLMTDDELINMPYDHQLVRHKGLPAPIYARKIRWFDDPAFGGKQQTQRPGGTPWRKRIPLLWRVVIGVSIWLGVMMGIRAYKDAQYQQVQTWQKK